MNELNSIISNAVLEYIKAKKISQESLGNQVGITQSSLSRALSGKKPWLVRDVEALSKIGLDFSDLLTREV